jgi:hypothetical protein
MLPSGKSGKSAAPDPGRKEGAGPVHTLLLERLEVEARLHEVVLSHYRARHMLPQMIDAFLGMLS